MPPVHLDFTVNVPLLLSAIAAIWAASARLTRIELKQDATREDLSEHTSREEKRFDDIRQKFHDISDWQQSSSTDRAVIRTRLETLEKGRASR